MYSIEIWGRLRDNTYVISQPLQDIAGIGVELTHTILEIAIQQINANRSVYYIFKTDNYLYIKELKEVVNKRNKLNRLEYLQNTC